MSCQSVEIGRMEPCQKTIAVGLQLFFRPVIQQSVSNPEDEKRQDREDAHQRDDCDNYIFHVSSAMSNNEAAVDVNEAHAAALGEDRNDSIALSQLSINR